MKELQDIVIAWKQLKERLHTAALATLIKVEGSAYRSPGAKMLITSDGQQIGTISGGCLESDVVKRSQEVLETGISALVKYDTTSEDDLIWGLGLGCQGVAYILIEQLNADRLNALSVIEQCLSTRQTGAVATAFEVESTNAIKKCTVNSISDRLLLNPDGNLVSQIGSTELKDAIVRDLQSVLQQKKSRSQTYMLREEIVEVFLEVIEPPTSLVIFGAGFDVLPVVRFAKELGWYVIVIDPQARLQTKERFSKCDRLILGSPDETAQLEFDEHTVAVAMSHNYLYDLDFLQTLTNIPLKYLGILGPKKRTNRLLQDLKYEDCVLQTRQIYSPVGLDIGANNPEEIALSIIAEIQAVTKERQGGFLRNRLTSIHAEQPSHLVSRESKEINK